MDFTRSTYNSLLLALQTKYNNFISFQALMSSTNSHKSETDHSLVHFSIVLRHDVDRIPNNSLKLAELEHSLGIKGTYYFRVVPESYDLNIMNKIAELGHEIGYHYEDVDLVWQKAKRTGKRIGNDELIDLAYESFCKNLELFRKNFDVKTICMHGSPRSKYDNKIIWSRRDSFARKYDYRDLGIIGEPYYDVDFNEFAYFTDTGRKWNGNGVSVRDKVDSKYNFNFKSTEQIIENVDILPEKVMFTIHPERWHNESLPWIKELVWQNVKNVVKRVIVSNGTVR
ncbi:MAG: hypothetical protein KKB34_11415 [Bacteroidetes bacterium]|nr:hypothetical protein [Bacteroidota bacterium]